MQINLFSAFRLPIVKALVVGLMVSSISACANLASYPEPSATPAQVEDKSIGDRPEGGNSVVDGDGRPLSDQSSIRVEELPAQNLASPVVQRLLASAEQQITNSDFVSAANSLERALRIEPRNAVLWNRLADIRYAQQNWQQAIQLAAKSNTLANSDRQLRRRNWYLMANAYTALDDTVQAQKYRDKLSAY